MSIRDKINTYPTKHIEGFTPSEIDSLLKEYPTVNREKFFEKLNGNTCMELDGEIIRYHCDIELALKCVLENRDPKTYEWD